jgi:hypothetical protein
MRAFHDDKAMAMLDRMPAARPELTPSGVPPPSPLTKEYRELRASLAKEGWFKRNVLIEGAQVVE